MASSTATRQESRRRVIERPRLTAMLDETTARIILLTAPAGYGKTTLAQQWLASRVHAWYRGTPASADVAALALGLAVTAAEVMPGAADRLRERLRATNHPEEEADILAELLAEDLEEWPEDAWLAVDDYQFAMEAEAAERFVERLVDLTALRLLITSRNRPSWISARRILYGEVFELERNALAMSDEEARAVLAHRGEHAPALVERAEGWPAVIGLAALTDSLRLPEGDLPSQLYDYFAEEVYNQAEPAVRWGICQLAIAPTITRELARTLFGDETGALIVDHGIRLGFFVPEEAAAYGLHPLLGDFLQTKVREGESTRNSVSEITAFLLARRRWDEAFRVIEHAPDDDALSGLIETALDPMLSEGRSSTIQRWVTFGRTQHVNTPLLDLAEAEVVFREGDYVRAFALASQAASSFGPRSPYRARALLRAGKSAHLNSRDDIALTLSQRAHEVARSPEEKAEASFGKLTAALELESPEVNEIASELDQYEAADVRTTLRLLTARGQFAIRRGRLQEELERLVAGLPLAPSVADPLARSSFLHVVSYALAMAARYREALETVASAIQDAQDYRLDFAVRHGLVTKAIALSGVRHFARARVLLDKAEREASRTGDTHVAWSARTIRIRLEIMSDAPPVSAPSATRAGHVVAKSMYGEYIASHALQLACGGNVRVASRLAAEAETSTIATEARCLVDWTRAIIAHGRAPNDAKRLTLEAFDETTRLGFIDLSVCAYRGFRPVLEVLAQDDKRRNVLANIMREARDTNLARTVGLTIPRDVAGVDALTTREAEVFELLSQGMSNRDIAETLFIAPATAKLHVRHILAKLGARSRTEAALRYRMD